MKRVTIIGGGLGGLIAAIQFARAGVACTLVEKKQYPFHRVCGEYISNEVVPFLKSEKLYPSQFTPPHIEKFRISSIDGASRIMPLEMGGFGISRYAFDNFLFEEATKAGVTFHHEEVVDVAFHNDIFKIKTTIREWECDLVVGSFGKRSKLDVALDRSFIKQRSPYVGVKYHVRIDNPDDVIALHNFPGGYCGMSNIEDGKTTICYLSHRDNLKSTGNIKEMEQKFLYRNPIIKEIFSNASFIFDKPEVINEISFATKSPVENHILMIGDAAGMIAPLCGNGMAMAIQSARLMVTEALSFLRSDNTTRTQMEQRYTHIWRQHFLQRLWFGRHVQKLFGKELSSKIAVSLVMNIPPVARLIVKNTHGKPF